MCYSPSCRSSDLDAVAGTKNRQYGGKNPRSDGFFQQNNMLESFLEN
jgi:hypothetical protein